MSIWELDLVTPYTKEENCYLFHVKTKAYRPRNESPMYGAGSVSCGDTLSESSQMLCHCALQVRRYLAETNSQAHKVESRLSRVRGRESGSYYLMPWDDEVLDIDRSNYHKTLNILNNAIGL